MKEDIVDFKDFRLYKTEVKTIKELEKILNLNINSIKSEFYNYPLQQRIFFTVFQNHIVGLDLENCNITHIPKNLTDLRFLMSLSLRFNQIRTIPQSISRLVHLKIFRLRRNSLKQLPDALFDLQELKSLELTYNFLSRIPDMVSKLKSLNSLYLDFNHLNSIPKSIGELKDLECVELDGNNIVELPRSLFQLKKLKYLTINEEILNKDTKIQLLTFRESHPNVRILGPPYEFRFFYEWGGHMIWKSNESSKKFGSPVNPLLLPISREIAEKLVDLNNIWENWENCNGIEKFNFYLETGKCLEKMSNELGPDFIFVKDYNYYLESYNLIKELDYELNREKYEGLFKRLIRDNNRLKIEDFIKRGFINFLDIKDVVKFLVKFSNYTYIIEPAFYTYIDYEKEEKSWMLVKKLFENQEGKVIKTLGLDKFKNFIDKNDINEFMRGVLTSEDKEAIRLLFNKRYRLMGTRHSDRKIKNFSKLLLDILQRGTIETLKILVSLEFLDRFAFDSTNLRKIKRIFFSRNFTEGLNYLKRYTKMDPWERINKIFKNS